MKQVFFHIGLPKTGTTTIQVFLREHIDTLKAAGIVYPFNEEFSGFKYFGEGQGQPPHSDILRQIYKLDAPHMKECGIDWPQTFDDFRSSDDKILIVSHELQSLRGRFMDMEVFKRYTRDLDSVFSLYLRDPVNWLNSLYTQTIVSVGLRFNMPFEHFPHYKHYIQGGFKGMIEPFERLGRVDVKNFDKLAKSNTLLPDFIDDLGAEDLLKLAEETPRKNTRNMDRDLIFFFRDLKHIEHKNKDFLAVKKRLASKYETQSGEVNKFVMPRHLAIALRSMWDKDRHSLEELYDVTFEDPKPLPDALDETTTVSDYAKEQIKDLVIGSDIVTPSIEKMITQALAK